ncbi:hypothetical protein ACHAW6_011677 [Cyclotella cf. meneghiniana]
MTSLMNSLQNTTLSTMAGYTSKSIVVSTASPIGHSCPKPP